MRELFAIYPKIQGFFFSETFWCFLRFKGAEFDQKRCKI